MYWLIGQNKYWSIAILNLNKYASMADRRELQA